MKITNSPHNNYFLLLLSTLQEKTNMNSKKSSTLGYITENCNTVPSGLNTPPNTTRLGTQQKTSKMKSSQSNTSTIDTQESPEWVNLVPTSEMGPHEGWGDPSILKSKSHRPVQRRAGWMTPWNRSS